MQEICQKYPKAGMVADSTFMPDFGIGWSSCDKLSGKSKEKVTDTIVSLGRKNDSDKGNN